MKKGKKKIKSAEKSDYCSFHAFTDALELSAKRVWSLDLIFVGFRDKLETRFLLFPVF